MRRCGIGLLLTLLWVGSQAAWCMELHVPFAKMTEESQFVFVGTVAATTVRTSPNEKMIFTDVHFRDLDIVYRDANCKIEVSDEVVLGFAGGELNGRGIRVSGVPSFAVGDRCVLFVRHDDPLVVSPLTRGQDALFRVIQDPQTGKSYPLTSGGRALIKLDEEGEMQATNPVVSISGDRVQYGPAKGLEDRPDEPAPMPEPSQDAAAAGAQATVSSVMDLKTPVVSELMDLRAFVELTKSLLRAR